jgi:hypothetical protein
VIWKGKELKTIGGIIDGIASCKTEDDAKEFTRLYKEENPYAIENIGYVIGYASSDERTRLYDLFGEHHPIFGRC